MNKNFLILGRNSLISKKTANYLEKKNFVKVLGSKDCNLLKKKEVEKLLANLKKKYILIIFSFIKKNKNYKTKYLKNIKIITN